MDIYEKLIELRDAERFGNLIGMKHVKVVRGYAEAELPVRPEFINLQGTIHGGVLLTLADVTGGTAACSYGKIVATVDNSYHFLRAKKDIKKLIAKATTIKAGRTIIVNDVKVLDQDGTLLGEGIFSYLPLDLPLEIFEPAATAEHSS